MGHVVVSLLQDLSHPAHCEEWLVGGGQQQLRLRLGQQVAHHLGGVVPECGAILGVLACAAGPEVRLENKGQDLHVSRSLFLGCFGEVVGSEADPVTTAADELPPQHPALLEPGEAAVRPEHQQQAEGGPQQSVRQGGDAKLHPAHGLGGCVVGTRKQSDASEPLDRFHDTPEYRAGQYGPQVGEVALGLTMFLPQVLIEDLGHGGRRRYQGLVEARIYFKQLSTHRRWVVPKAVFPPVREASPSFAIFVITLVSKFNLRSFYIFSQGAKVVSQVEHIICLHCAGE
mmetsp:Transcript_3740/g.8035  ORF Transcript_3740/g.8035 Transcript_3740/m.8035 type:complete len:286 (-) Transcript_3740:351-1208(-)